jgi:hypothetical protein
MTATSPAAASPPPGNFQLAVEPTVWQITPPAGNRAWGLAAGTSLAVGLTDRFGLQLLLSRGLWSESGYRIASMGAGSLVYNIDVLSVTPFFELGGAAANLRHPKPREVTSRETGFLAGAGFDWTVNKWLRLGVVMRYATFFGSSLLDRPGFLGIYGRASVVFGLPLLPSSVNVRQNF